MPRKNKGNRPYEVVFETITRNKNIEKNSPPRDAKYDSHKTTVIVARNPNEIKNKKRKAIRIVSIRKAINY